MDNQTGILKDLVRWVADADVAIQREAINWDFLYKTNFSVSTVQGTATYNKPSDYGKWDHKTFYLDYSLASNVQLTEIEYREYYNTYGVGVQTQRQPVNFVLPPSNNIILYSVPDAVYTLTANYWCAPVRMSSGTGVSVIPETYIRCIIARAKMYYAISEESDPLYAEAKVEYDMVLSELKSDQLPGWKEYRISDDVELTVSTDGFSDSFG